MQRQCFTAYSQKTFQHRMVIILTAADPEGEPGQICDGDIGKSGVSCQGYIRTKGIAQPGFCQGERTFYIFCEIVLIRRQMGEEFILDREDGIWNLAGRAGDNTAGQHIFGERFILCQRMFGRADAGNRGRRKFFEIQRRFFLPFFYVKCGMDLLDFPPAPAGKEKGLCG